MKKEILLGLTIFLCIISAVNADCLQDAYELCQVNGNTYCQCYEQYIYNFCNVEFESPEWNYYLIDVGCIECPENCSEVLNCTHLIRRLRTLENQVTDLNESIQSLQNKTNYLEQKDLSLQTFIEEVFSYAKVNRARIIMLEELTNFLKQSVQTILDLLRGKVELCGNGLCETEFGETSLNCPKDCHNYITEGCEVICPYELCKLEIYRNNRLVTEFNVTEGYTKKVNCNSNYWLKLFEI